MSGIADCTCADGVESVNFDTVGNVDVVITETPGDVATVTGGVVVAGEAGTRSFGIVGSVDASDEEDDLRACSS